MAGDLMYAFRVMRLPLLDAGGATIGRIQDLVAVSGRQGQLPRLVGFVAEIQRRRIFVNSHASPSSVPMGPVCAVGTSTSTRSSPAPERC